MNAQLSPDPRLGIAMPVYNEERWLDIIIERVLKRPECHRLVAVDDGSTDDSWRILRQWQETDSRISIRRHQTNRGKGAAIRTALQDLDAPLILIQDADLEYTPEDYPRLLAPILEDRADVVYGSRFLRPRTAAGGGRRSRALNPFRWHTVGNWLLTWIGNRLTGLKLTDEATCYKLFRREVLDGIELTEDGFEFCPEVTAKVAKSVLRGTVRIVEVPIQYQHRTVNEGKKIRLRDGISALRSLWKYSR